MAGRQSGRPISSGLDHPGARAWSPSWGCFGAALTLLIPLLMLIVGWSLRGLPNLPTPQLRPGKVPEAHWDTAASMATPRADFAAVAVDGRIWALGGVGGANGARLGTSEVFDPASGTWSAGPALPGGRSDFGAATVGQTIYAIGGATDTGARSATVQALDTTTGQWRDRAPLPAPLADAAVLQLNGTIYVIGGDSGNGAVATVYAYNPATDTWRTAAALANPRSQLAATVLQGKIYAIGGVVGGQPSATTEVYDPAADSWTPGAVLLAPMTQFGAVTVDNRIFAVDQRSHEMLDPRVNRWVQAEGMPTPRQGDTVVALDNALYALGGSAFGSPQSVGTVEAYLPGAAEEADNFRLVGINRGGSIAVILGFFVTVGLIVLTLRTNRRSPSPGSRTLKPLPGQQPDGDTTP